MKLYDSYQTSKKGKNIPFSAFLLLVLFLSIFLFNYMTEGDYNSSGDLSVLFSQYVFTYLIIYLVLQGVVNLIAWIINNIRGKVYKMKEYEALLLIPTFLFYISNGIVFTSVIIGLTILIYVLYLSPSKQKEEKTID